MISPARAIIAILVALTLTASACGSDSDTGAASSRAADGELLDFSLVQESDFTFEADPTNPGRGIFRVRTTEPMICAIVWGETSGFGNFNNSLAMNGTGIVDHDVFLPGAEPGVTYTFQVQGTTADGRQFRSQTGTFTIPAPDDAASDDAASADRRDLGSNLAVDATVVDASSSFGPGWEPANAIDGDTNTEWATAGDGDNGSITIDLGSPHGIAAVEFLTRSMLDGTALTDTYTLSIDGADPLGPFPAGNPADPRTTDVDATGQILTFEVERSSGGNVGAIEIGVYAPAP